MNPIRSSVVILGNSNVGWGIAQKGLELNYRVMITTRQKFTSFLKPKNIEYLHTPAETIKDPKFWQDLARQSFHKDEPLLVVNTIGGSIPSANETIEDLNVNIPLSAIEGIRQGVLNTNNIKVIQLSTMAAAGLKAPYGVTKREAEKRLIALNLPHLTIFRMGYVVEALIRNQVTQTYKNHHRLSIEELALLPIQLLIGDHAQYHKIQVPIVSIDDVATAVFNVCKRPPHVKIIDAVSREIITQEQLSKFMRDLLGKKFRPLYIPLKAAEKLAKHHSFGHLIDYAIEYCALQHDIRLDPQEFEELIGRPLQTLSQLYRLEANQELIIPKPPLGAFFIHLMKSLWNHPQSLIDTIHATALISKSLFNQKSNTSFKPLTCPAPKEGYPFTSVSEDNFNKKSERNRRNFARSISKRD